MMCTLFWGSALNGKATAAEPSLMERNGYSFRFESRIEDAKGDLAGQTVGRILITRPGDLQPVYLEHTALLPGCGKQPPVQFIGEQYVAFCGHLGGRHYTWKIFTVDMTVPVMASLDMHDTPGQMELGPNGHLVSMAYLRDLFPAALAGARYFPFVYKSYHDPVTFGFRPSFDQDVSHRYLAYYRQLKGGTLPERHVPEMLAALMASRSSSTFCAELGHVEALLDKDGTGRPAGEAVAAWLKKLEGAGYPVTETSVCKRKPG